MFEYNNMRLPGRNKNTQSKQASQTLDHETSPSLNTFHPECKHSLPKYCLFVLCRANS